MDIYKKTIGYLTVFQWSEILVVVSFTIYFAFIDTKNPLWYMFFSSVASICGIFCVVLCASGKKSQYYWGFANIVAYVIVSWTARYYGEVMLNAFYYLPTQFMGMYVWNKNYNNDTKTVQCKKMTVGVTIAFLAISLLGIWLYRLFLVFLGGKATWLDSMSTTFSLFANILMVLRYREQWVLWIIVDGVTIIMWVMAGDWIMTTMWSVYLINAFYGLYMWTKLNKFQGDGGR
ncbi:MAG: nicotinamide mononucleotide transporter PnuC [Clostridiales bacterium 43-6]|nr:MAG: nicotinamide mononucleotide transporter PnuC [Clostridiales bacterium 43-6]